MAQFKTAEEWHTPSQWLTWGSASFLLLAVGLFLVSLTLDARDARFASLLIPGLLVSIFAVVVFRFIYWHEARTRQIAAQAAVSSREREFASVFENTLDGILILDDASVCLDANPAACRLLEIHPSDLIGRVLGEFYPDQQKFLKKEKSPLSAVYQRGEAQLLGGDRKPVFVEYISTGNYVPGRHVLILRDTTPQKRAENSLNQLEEYFRHMADNIQEVFWMMDAETKKVIYVNRAFETLTGRLRSSLNDDPLSYGEIIHSEDRSRVLTRLANCVSSGEYDLEFRITRADGKVRWIWSRVVPVRNEEHAAGWLIGTALDVTDRKLAETQISSHLAAVESAQSEAQALRRSTLALTQNLAMDSILDTLLACLHDVVPYSSAAVLFTESDFQLLIAREAPRKVRRGEVIVFDPVERPLLNKALHERTAVFVADTQEEPRWGKCKALPETRSWMAIPLIAADQVLGVLSISATAPHAFTHEHFRMAKSLAIPAAVGIQNARTQERAVIYAAELEVQLHALQVTRKALEDSRSIGPASN